MAETKIREIDAPLHSIPGTYSEIKSAIDVYNKDTLIITHDYRCPNDIEVIKFFGTHDGEQNYLIPLDNPLIVNTAYYFECSTELIHTFELAIKFSNEGKFFPYLMVCPL